ADETDLEYSEPRRYKIKKNRVFIPDIPIDDDDAAVAAGEASDVKETPEEIDERIFDEAMRRTKARRAAEEKVSADEADTADKTDPDQLPLKEMPDTDDAGVTETVPPVETSSTDDTSDAAGTDSSGRVDLKKIFVNPEDAELLDRLADAYLNGDSEALKAGGEETEDDLTITRVG
ncbi:MAG: hypothetical protein IKV40_06435, partial [Clostridia bacterium]|nr:hypothetical protein [Clostridia bacterium]